eukprot:4401043-Pleurochrysis_carterae.AAC.2
MLEHALTQDLLLKQASVQAAWHNYACMRPSKGEMRNKNESDASLAACGLAAKTRQNALQKYAKTFLAEKHSVAVHSDPFKSVSMAFSKFRGREYQPLAYELPSTSTVEVA